MLLVGLALALRALALPFDMTAPRAVGESVAAASVAPAPSSACHASPGASHQDAPADDQTLRKPHGDARVCQILCAIACAPLLFETALPPVLHAGAAPYDAPPPLPLGVASPPDHPPPIA